MFLACRGLFNRHAPYPPPDAFAAYITDSSPLFLPPLSAQKIEELSAEVREFVAIEDAAVIPISAHTGYGLDSLRTTLAAALVQHPTLAPTPPERQPGVEASEGFGSESGAAAESLSASQVPGAEGGAGDAVAGSQDDALSAVGGAPRGEFEVVMADAPEGAAMATVLDYTSSAKTGKVLVSFDVGLTHHRESRLPC